MTRSRRFGLPVGDRDILTGFLFALKTGIGWDDLPRRTGLGLQEYL